MSRNDFKIGQRVYFGRSNGEQTLGVIEKMGPARAKVRTLEGRGRVRVRDVGTVWTVPYSLMQPAGAGMADEMPPAPKAPLVYNPLAGNENLLLEALLSCYATLSPENLCCDGEASAAQIRRTSAELHRTIRGLTIALGRTVEEGEVYAWHRSKQDFHGKTPGKMMS